MSTQPILLVIGIAIAVNLVIMGALVVTLVVRRRTTYATPDGIVEPAPHRYDAMTTTPPTTTSAISFIGEEDEEEPYDRASEDDDDNVSATEPTDFRPLRAVMADEDEPEEETLTTAPAAVPPSPARPITTPPAEAPPIPARPVLPQPEAPLARPAPVASAASSTSPATDERLDWQVRLRNEEARLARYRRPVSVVLVEIDGMERLVQRLGPDAAERLVPPIRQTLGRQARAADYVARIGPSRFGVLLPETDEIQAINYVERIRADCDRWLAAGAVATRLAIGWACPTPGGDLRTAIRQAEDRLNVDRRRAFLRTEYESDLVAEAELSPPSGVE